MLLGNGVDRNDVLQPLLPWLVCSSRGDHRMLHPEILQGPAGAQILQEHPQNSLTALDLNELQGLPEMLSGP